ncbi:glycine oxidase ThiO [Roseomonas marmotae]|uniref:D-amino-acid oxidase n=1 Tax=Roseomonas marmotae TaxID=2768161 RepID=A0ABS3K8M2_9PROT|nr:glycine oxidase ThiO [Roseomonas marmotae]MBO1073810.1 glycine oxidase ThiO [Roseomonas marmotae]QTI78560.1 glycine oxidase ThiO [Roseomonas marmotae]
MGAESRAGRPPEVLVVGAGVAGLVTATVLAGRGAAVTLIDRADPATRASHFAGGMLAPWCEAADASPALIAPGIAAIDWWAAHAPGTSRQGSLVLAAPRDLGELNRFSRRTTGHRPCDAGQIAALEPDLAGRFGQGLFFPEEAHLDPRAALATLADKLRQRGVAFRVAEATERDHEGFDHVIDCRGHAAAPVLPDLRGVRGEMLVLRCPGVTLHRPVRLLHPRIPLYIVPRGDGRFMVGATMIESADRRAVTARSAMELLNAAYALHPGFAEAEILEMGSNIRPAFPDNMPALRRQGRVLHINGMYRHGFLLSPSLAQRAAATILGENTPSTEEAA